jgi:hypothetical protein
MKKIIIIVLIILTACEDKKKITTTTNQNAIGREFEDSVKWMAYAYTYNSIALFEKNNVKYDLKPTECEIELEKRKIVNDSIFYSLRFAKDDLKYLHLYEGFPVFGIVYSRGIYKPLTGIVILDSFDYPTFAKFDNKKTDSGFISFLRTVDSSKINSWLLNQCKLRKVF